MFEHPLTSDAFINDTLEHLRRSARIGISRGDEQQIEQTLRAMAAQVGVYAGIDYASEGAAKIHAHIAASYLCGEIELIVPHNMADVLMEGVRLMGQCADLLLRAEGPRAIGTLTEKIGIISCVVAAREDHRPVTLTGVEQLARLSFDLLRTRSYVHVVQFAARDIRSSMRLIARVFLALPDTPLLNVTRTYLAPYYSLTSTQGLIARLTALVNELSDAGADDVNARQIIQNIGESADGLREEREILLEAIARRSSFAFDMIGWIRHVTTALLAVSNVPACSAHARIELRRHARALISALSFIPEDAETVRFVETYQMTDTLFEAAIDAHNRECEDVSETIGDRLLAWAFNAGRHQTGRGILERALSGFAVLALLEDEAVARLREKIQRRLAQGNLPDQEVLDNAARALRGRAAALAHIRHAFFAIERSTARAEGPCQGSRFSH